jgi:glutathione synthase/RimK-type ligase-like ATP-grasp enzyme
MTCLLQVVVGGSIVDFYAKIRTQKHSLIATLNRGATPERKKC